VSAISAVFGQVESNCMNATHPSRRLLFRLVSVLTVLVIASGTHPPYRLPFTPRVPRTS